MPPEPLAAPETLTGTGEPGSVVVTPVAAAPSAGRLQRFARALSPVHLVLAAAAGWVLWLAVSPVNDVDSYWHVLIGRQLLARHTLTGLGGDWLADPPAGHWLTSQWLSEAGMARLVDTFGWGGLIAVRVLLVAALIMLVAAAVLPGRPALLATPVALATVLGLGLSALAQDRPQTVSLVLLAGLGWIAARLQRGQRTPHPLLIALGCLLWAQLHPLWILAPAAFGLLALGALADGPRRNRALLRRSLLCLAAGLAGVLNPHGPGAFLLPLTFRASTGVIAEWRPSNISYPAAVALSGLVLLAVLAWARFPGTAPRAPLLWVLAWAAFGTLASRNLGPALLLCAPVVADAADRTWGGRLRATQTTNGRREGLVLAGALGLFVAAGIAVTAVALSRVDPLKNAPARHIAERLAASPEPVRVLNSYNAGGALAAFGGGRVRVAVDGRADLWGGAYITRITDVTSLHAGWEATFTQFRPQALVLTKDAPLAVLLEHDGTWRVVQTDGDYVLLLPARPTAVAAP